MPVLAHTLLSVVRVVVAAVGVVVVVAMVVATVGVVVVVVMAMFVVVVLMPMPVVVPIAVVVAAATVVAAAHVHAQHLLREAEQLARHKTMACATASHLPIPARPTCSNASASLSRLGMSLPLPRSTSSIISCTSL